MKKIIFFIAVVCSFICCKGESRNADDSVNGYPREISQLGLENLYDKARWYMYCIHSDGKLRFTEKSGVMDRDVTFGTLPLEFDHLELRGDTVEIDFFFYYNGTRVDRSLIEFSPYWGVVFVGKSDSIAMYSSRTTARYIQRKCYNPEACIYREEVPLQPEVVKYIQTNMDRLDPWFRNEAIKKGVIN